MPRGVVLPRLLGFRLRGFQPVFQTDVSLTLRRKGPYVILGGNGLGKTTLMQAVIYGLADGLTESIEDEKSCRWDHGYFRNRLNSRQIGLAHIEVDLAFGQTILSIRRGFRNGEIIAFKMDGSDWMENAEEAQEAFLNVLQAEGGYKTIDEFRFLVHRLLYLPESRRLIAWDANAQVRILMLLNQDVADEKEFRARRSELQLMDSRKRHIHVALGKAEQQLQRLMEYDEADDTEDEEELPEDGSQETLEQMVQKLTTVARQRAAAEQEARVTAADLSRITTEIEALRQQVDDAEASLVGSFLTEEERAHDLALHKLLQNAICPVCGTRRPDLGERAHAYAVDHRCMLCGGDQPHETNPELGTLRSQLAERIRSQQAVESEYRRLSGQLTNLRQQEDSLQSEVNRVRFAQPVVALVERDLPANTRTELTSLKRRLQQQEADLESQIHEKRVSLESDYEAFKVAVDSRVQELHHSFEQYATHFLGLPCTLSEGTQGGIIGLTRFVPTFLDVPRETPDACSEAQRFFLDIAFRLALIESASVRSGDTAATFFCETPENSLDMSYIDNVVNMLAQFTNKGNTLLLSANIQPGGVAEKLMQQVPPRFKPAHVVNLLDYGQLTEVHRAALRTLRQTAKRLTSART